MQNRWKVLILAIAMAFLLLEGAFAGGGKEGAAAPAASAKPYLVATKPGPFVVGLSNSFSGNSWRAQMVAEFRNEAEKLKANGTLKDYIVADATGSTASQIQQIQNMVAEKVDAILIDANSLTALNPAIEAAHKAGILVVSYDNVVDSPYSMTVNIAQEAFGQIGAEWLVKKLGGQGNIIVLNGLEGTPGNDQRWSGAKAVFDKNPGIKILASVNADWDQAKGQQAMGNLLPSFPKIDGVWSQGGAMTLGAIYAFQAAGRPLVPMAGEANNGLLKVWKKNLSNGFDSIGPSDPATIGATTLDVAVKALSGQSVPKDTLLDPPVITSETLDKYVQPDLSDALWLPTNLSADQLKALFH
jgi:ribose transport system substrate-binding protein